jgi:phage tail-like protein
VARWTFLRALPSKVSGPALNAKTGEIAIEELHLVHEGLRLEGP